MSTTRHISREALARLVDDLASEGVRVIAPARATDGRLEYQPIGRLEEAELDAGEMPRRSLRALFQPPTETLFGWIQTENGIGLAPTEPDRHPQVVLGARPCDAAGAAILDAVMDWDYHDDLWFARREATTIVSIACDTVFPTCFCESVGQGRASTRGSDLLLHAGDDGYQVEVVTEKGESFVAAYAARFTEAPAEKVPVKAEGASLPELPLAVIQEWLEGHFEDEMWKTVALRCLGCGACTSVCPTCHCFDLVDEPDGTTSGTRRRNWDTCQASLFTLHASGHNPRSDQTARCRQRVMHKFAIYPSKFGQVLCTGCGRCISACPAGVDLTEILKTIARRMSGIPPVAPSQDPSNPGEAV